EPRESRYVRKRLVGERLRRNRHHVPRACEGRLYFTARLLQRLAHLARDLGRDPFAVLLERGAEALAESHAIAEGRSRPGVLRPRGARDDGLRSEERRGGNEGRRGEGRRDEKG